MAAKTIALTPTAIGKASSELNTLDKVLMIVGGIAMAAFAIASYVYSPSLLEKEQAARVAMLPEHVKVCEKLGKVEAADRDNCIKLLDELQTTHKQAFLAEATDI